jgi:hypothetical protein
MITDLTVTLASTLQAIRARQRLLLCDMDEYIAARQALRKKLAEHVIALKTYRNALIADGTASHEAGELGHEIREIELLIADIPAKSATGGAS